MLGARAHEVIEVVDREVIGEEGHIHDVKGQKAR